MLVQSTRSSRSVPSGSDPYRESSRSRHERAMDRMAFLDLHRDAEQQSIMLRLQYRNLSKERADANWARSQRRQIASKNRYFERKHMKRLPDAFDPAEHACANADVSSIQTCISADDYDLLHSVVALDIPRHRIASDRGVSVSTVNRRLNQIMTKIRQLLPTSVPGW